MIAFDTLKLVEKLEAGGFTHQQAKAAAEAFTDATGQELATKADLAGGRTELASVKSELKADIELAKRDLKTWFGSAMIGGVGILLTAIRYLPPHPGSRFPPPVSARGPRSLLSLDQSARDRRRPAQDNVVPLAQERGGGGKFSGSIIETFDIIGQSDQKSQLLDFERRL